jgi:hypothetical protein
MLGPDIVRLLHHWTVFLDRLGKMAVAAKHLAVFQCRLAAEAIRPDVVILKFARE